MTPHSGSAPAPGGPLQSRPLAELAHDLRAPAAAILGWADLLVSKHQGPPDQLERLMLLRSQAELLLHSCDRLLLRPDGATPTIHPIQPLPLARELLALMAPAARARGLSLTVEAASALPEEIPGDATELRQALINLLANALKFTHEGGVRLRLAACRDARGHRLRIEVRDTGLGMDPGQLAALDRPLVQVHSSSTARGGIGLGLSLTRRSLERLGGRLEISSVRGQGSSFTLDLPGAEPQAVSDLPGDDPLAGRDCLLVEDERSERLLASVLLKHAGLGLKAPATLDEALALAGAAANHPYALALVSSRFAATLPRLRSSGGIRRLLVLVESGETPPADADGILRRPLNIEELRTLA